MRHCSYKPEKDMIIVRSYDGQDQKYLEVKYRVQWFHQYCEENGIVGFIDDSDIRFMPEAGLLLATAIVYMDEKVAGKSIAGAHLDSLDPLRASTIVQTIATQAKGRALANAGFGSANVSAAEEGDSSALCDAGIPVSSNEQEEPKPEKRRGRPRKKKEEETQAPSETLPVASGEVSPADVPVETSSPEVPSEPIVSPPGNTGGVPSEGEYRAALQVILPVGQHKGKTFQQALAENPTIAQWYRDNFRNERRKDVREAAICICEYREQQ